MSSINLNVPTTFQDVVRCKVCSYAPATAHCDSCQIYICDDCLAKHFRSDLSKQHVIVDCKKRSKIKLSECRSHSNQRCDLHCQMCNKPVCSKCIAGSHVRHPVSDILEYCRKMQERVREDYKEIQKSKIPELEKAKSQLSDQIVALSLQFDEISASILKHGTNWHKQVDCVVQRLTGEVEEMKKTQLTVLRRQESQLNEMIRLGHQIMQQNIKILQSHDASTFTEYKSRMQELSCIPRKDAVTLPSFKTLSIEKVKFSKMFGYLESHKRSTHVKSSRSKTADSDNFFHVEKQKYEDQRTMQSDYLDEAAMLADGHEYANFLKRLFISGQRPCVSDDSADDSL